uniref:Secreted protein n=1 Tax=Anopheles merus TaxID=30066 RepID=A0A9I3MH52_ANOME
MAFNAGTCGVRCKASRFPLWLLTIDVLFKAGESQKTAEIISNRCCRRPPPPPAACDAVWQTTIWNINFKLNTLVREVLSQAL